MCSVFGQSLVSPPLYGDDHHHCWVVSVITRLIEGAVVLDESLGVNLRRNEALVQPSRVGHAFATSRIRGEIPAADREEFGALLLGSK